MSKIIIGTGINSGKPIGFDLKTLILTRLLIQANSGGGKSWLIRVLAEQAFGKIQLIIIDKEGEFATLRERFDYVLAGKGGETPADVRSAGMLAHKLLELNASAVCDLYDLKISDRHRWVRLFLESLLDAPKSLWHPVLVVVDEAHIFCPEKGAGESEASDAMIALASQGRKRGFCAVFATQRLGKLRKDAAAELLNILIGQTFIDIDRKRAAEALGTPRSEERKFFEEMKVMEPGLFFALGRAVSKERVLVSIGKVATTHPEAGGKYAATPPPAPKNIKALLPSLADLPKEAETKAKTEAELRAEIRSLKGMISAKPAPPKVEIQKVGMSPQETRKLIQQVEEPYKKQLSQVQAQTARLIRGLVQITDLAKSLSGEKQVERMKEINVQKLLKKLPAVEIQKGEPRVRPLATVAQFINHPRPEPPSNGDVKLASGARRLLAALVSWHPNGMKEGQWRSHAGLKKSGTADTYKSALRSAGFIEQRDWMFFATDAGVDYIGDKIESAPTTTEEVLKLWESKLASGARRILQVLVEAGGEAVSQEEISEKTGLQKSGTFDTYISALRTAQLANKKNGQYYANSETLFL